MSVTAAEAASVSHGSEAGAGCRPSRGTAGSLELASSLGIDPERLLLDAAALRRRQLCAAFLHGSARSWRVRRRIWPAAVAGLLIVALAIAALAVAAAFAAQQRIDDERQSQSQSQSIQWEVIDAQRP